MNGKVALALDIPNKTIYEVVFVAEKVVNQSGKDPVHCMLYLNGDGEFIQCTTLEGHDFITVIPADLDKLFENVEFTILREGPSNCTWKDYKNTLVKKNWSICEELAVYDRESTVDIENLIKVLHRITGRIFHDADLYK